MVTLADQYYLKAVEDYPYYLEESLENLNYALSYDGEHVGALYLMACFYMEQLNNYELAEDYFLQAIAVDPKNEQACTAYATLLIHLQEFDTAKKMTKYLHGLRGVDKAKVFALEAISLEAQKQYAEALSVLKQAKLECFNKEMMDELNEIHQRIEEKQKLNRPYFFEE